MGKSSYILFKLAMASIAMLNNQRVQPLVMCPPLRARVYLQKLGAEAINPPAVAWHVVWYSDYFMEVS